MRLFGVEERLEGFLAVLRVREIFVFHMTTEETGKTVPTVPTSKRPITAWGLLDWAYRKECVRAAGAEESDDWRWSHSSCHTMLERIGMRGKGAINASLLVHEDAIAVDDLVRRVDRRSYIPIVRAAERGIPLGPTIRVPPPKPVPRLDDRDRPTIVYGRRGALFCIVDYEGYSEEEAASIRARHAKAYADFVAVLDLLTRRAFTRWKVTGVGLDEVARIIDNGATKQSTA